MNKLNLSFRDYLVYMFPGALTIFSFFLIDPNGLEWIERHRYTSGIIFLVGGYVLGMFINGIAHMFIIKNIMKKFGNPSRILSTRESHFLKKLDTVYEKQLKQVLINEWGEDLVNKSNENNLLLLCLRKTQENPHPAHETIARVVSFHEFYATMTVAIPIFSTALIYHKEYIAGIIILFSTYRAIAGYYTFRRQFVINIYRIFFIQHRKKMN